jgi:hypothetical protein
VPHVRGNPRAAAGRHYTRPKFVLRRKRSLDNDDELMVVVCVFSCFLAGKAAIVGADKYLR